MRPFFVVIPSAIFSNLDGCVRSILESDSGITPDKILIVDDGSKASAPPDFPAVKWIEGIKPFVIDRNINLAIEAVNGADLLLINDDARLVTKDGFSRMAEFMEKNQEFGLCSAAIDGFVGNPNQHQRPEGEYHIEPAVIAFVCVYLPAKTIHRIGLLDERFIYYGGDDKDYCDRILAAGMKMAVFDQCVVNHGTVPSTFRSQAHIGSLFQQANVLYDQKMREKKGLRINLGSLDDPLSFEFYVNPSQEIPAQKLLKADLSGPWPWEDSSVAVLRAFDLIQHIENKIHFMNEAWRVLEPNGLLHIRVPTSNAAWFDPTNVSVWNRGTFDFFIDKMPEHTGFSGPYGIKARFKVLMETRNPELYEYRSGKVSMDHLEIILVAVK